MKLPNFNVDTIASFLEDALTRLENLEKVVVPLVADVSPAAGAIGAAAEGATEAAGTLVGDVRQGADSLTGNGQTARQPAPLPQQRQPAQQQQTQPPAPTGAAAIIARAANGQA